MQNMSLTTQWTEIYPSIRLNNYLCHLTCENFKYNIKFMCRSKSLHCT